ncbi:MAG: response regulator [Candidatus Paceibacterota bacterium]
MKKILIVEDDVILASTIADNLIQAGFDIVKAKDGEEGLALAFSEKPDLILLDILLPKMDGLTMLKRLRLDPWGKDVPVIILSNLSEPLNIADAIGDGVRDYLVKVDWKIEDVVKRIKTKLNA